METSILNKGNNMVKLEGDNILTETITGFTVTKNIVEPKIEPKSVLDTATASLHDFDEDAISIQETQKSSLRKWSDGQTKFLLSLYAKNFRYVGPLDKFRSRRDMWNFIALEIKKKFNIEFTGIQVETRFRCVHRRTKKAIDFNFTSEDDYTKNDNEEEGDVEDEFIFTKNVESNSKKTNSLRKATLSKPTLTISEPKLEIKLKENDSMPPKKRKRKTPQQQFFERSLALKREKYKLMEKIFLEREQRKKQEAEQREKRLELIREVTKRCDERYTTLCQRLTRQEEIPSKIIKTDMDWNVNNCPIPEDAVAADPVVENTVTQNSITEPLKLVIENPRSLLNLELPEIAFEYVDIKEEPNRQQNPLKHSTFIPSTINTTLPPFINIKSEPDYVSPPLSPNIIDSPVPQSLKRELIDDYSTQITSVQSFIQQECKPLMIEHGCQTDEVISNDVSLSDNDIIIKLMRQNEQLKQRLAENQFGKIPMEILKSQVKKLKYLTGFPNFSTLEIIYKDVEDDLSFGGRMTKFDVFFMTWMKLKLDLSLNYLSIIMSMTITTVTRLFYETFDLLYAQLNKYVVWPDKIENADNISSIYKKVFGDRNFIIIDYIDTFRRLISKLSNVTPLPDTSVYDRRLNEVQPESQTKRYLICFSTATTIIYQSKSFDTELSKRDVVKQSGFLDKLKTEDIIFADREFISNSVYKQKSKVKDVIPMVKNTNGELVEVAFLMNDDFDKIREDVIKKILLVKQRIMLLTNRPPLLAVTNKYGEEMYSDFVMKTACAIVNLTPPHLYDVSAEEKDDIDI